MLSHFSHVWLCNPVDCSPPDSSGHGMLQARILENTEVGWQAQGLHLHLLCLLHRQVSSWPPVPPAAAAAAKSLQSCSTLCDPIDGSPPGSPVPGILQTRTLEWVAISFSNEWKWKVKSLSGVQLLATPWTTAYQAPPSMGFSRQEYSSGVPLLSPSLFPTTKK